MGNVVRIFLKVMALIYWASKKDKEKVEDILRDMGLSEAYVEPAAGFAIAFVTQMIEYAHPKQLRMEFKQLRQRYGVEQIKIAKVQMTKKMEPDDVFAIIGNTFELLIALWEGDTNGVSENLVDLFGLPVRIAGFIAPVLVFWFDHFVRPQK